MVKKKSFNKKAKKKLVITISTILVLALLVYSVFYIISLFDYEYNGYDFSKRPDGLWSVPLMTVIGEESVMFYYHPRDLERFYFEDGIVSQFSTVRNNRGTVKIGIDESLLQSGRTAIAGVEISKVTGKVIGLETKSGSIQPLDIEDLPTYNCDNASANNFVVQFTTGDEDKVFLEDDFCATLEVTELANLVKLADLFVYKIIGVME